MIVMDKQEADKLLVILEALTSAVERIERHLEESRPRPVQLPVAKKSGADGA